MESVKPGSAMLDPPPGRSGEIDVKCVGISKSFRDFWLRPRVRAVESLDLEIRRGEIYGLLGPNGSGKSTTIKMLLGLVAPTAGRIAVLGRRPRDVATKRHVGYLPEESYLYPFLSARETLDFYGRLFKIPARVRQERIDRLLEMVGLDAVGHRPVGEFSKGMQRRVGLAQSLINDPQLLILDEPTSGMDPVGARQIRDLIADLGRRGKTVLLCTHQLSDVEDLCDRVAIMFGGRIRAEDRCADLLREEGATTIHTPALAGPVTDEIRALLARHGIGPVQVERPRRRLEEVFLEVVERARAEGLQTSGAKAGGPVPDFLRGDESVGSAAAGAPPAPSATVDTALIDSLVGKHADGTPE
ncbi:MAG: ABC transporter ATP-binding protein [Planctomycetota bacterium]|nr:MAG: ABC transporter ATP-binding protein [Planctomycetota bacterium]